MRNVRLHANGHIISIHVDDIAFGMLLGNDAFSPGADPVDGDPNGACTFSDDIYLTSDCKLVEEVAPIETDVAKTGDVTIILTPPSGCGEKVVVDTEAFIADVIANHLGNEPLGDRLKRAEIALLEAKLAKVRSDTGTGVERFDRYVASAGPTDTKRVVMDHLYRTEPWLRDRVDQWTREMMPTLENPYTPLGVWGVESPNKGPVGEPA